MKGYHKEHKDEAKDHVIIAFHTSIGSCPNLHTYVYKSFVQIKNKTYYYNKTYR